MLTASRYDTVGNGAAESRRQRLDDDRPFVRTVVSSMRVAACPGTVDCSVHTDLLGSDVRYYRTGEHAAGVDGEDSPGLVLINDGGP